MPVLTTYTPSARGLGGFKPKPCVNLPKVLADGNDHVGSIPKVPEVCVIEWQTGHRIFLSFMSELLRRTADLLNEALSPPKLLNRKPGKVAEVVYWVLFHERIGGGLMVEHEGSGLGQSLGFLFVFSWK